MEYSVISSRNNDKIKYFSKLVSDSSLRREESLFTLEGARLCADAVSSGCTVKELFITEKALEKYSDMLKDLLDNAVGIYLVTEEVAAKLSDTVSPQGVFAVAKAREQGKLFLIKERKYVALENVQNPQNLGSVARTAEALGIDALIVSGGCDIYNPKALRASMGSLLRIPVFQISDLVSVITQANDAGLLTVATVPDRSAEDITQIDFSDGALTVIGNEGNGVSDEIKSLCSVKATIKMNGKAESLNASAAASICMWEMVR